MFYSANDLNNRTPNDNIIINVYFAFTTLSTVGLGDYYPKGDLERVVWSIVLLSGVAMFSFIMGNFIEVI
jgi:hypothetical protein